MNGDFKTLLHEIHTDLGGDFISIGILSPDGISIASESASNGFNSERAAAHFAAIIKLASELSTNLKFGKVLENQLSTEKFVSVTRPLGDGSFYCLLIAKPQSTLVLLRTEIDQYELRLWGILEAR